MRALHYLLVATALLGLGMALAACTPAASSPSAPAEAATSNPASSTSAVDPRNATYLIDGKEVTLVNGVTRERSESIASRLAQFRAVKQAFDPQCMLNPGKAIPQPRHCSEYKALGKEVMTAPGRRGEPR